MTRTNLSRGAARAFLWATLGGALLTGCPSDPVVPGADAGGDTAMPDTGMVRDGGSDVGPRDTGTPVDGGSDTGTDAGPICGDGTLATSEACDDGNADDGDGCSADCMLEAGWDCSATSPTTCDEICGDGVVVGDEAGALGCDDGNNAAGDGCDDLCAVERGFACSGEPSTCTAGCGDGIVAGSEACDDGAMVDGDGCSAACAFENGYTCSGEPSACTSTCGDGLVAAGAEACDDANLIDADGCDALCAVEAGFGCTGEPSVCATVCGDGTMASTEACDDGNLVDDDGCDSNCTVTACGNGIVTFGEFCDDGNTTSGDGCHADCISELEIEPNDDGATVTGGSGIAGNDFDGAGGMAVANANNNGIITDTFVMRAAIGTAGDEDVFALANTTAFPVIYTIQTYEAADGTCATIDTGLNIRSDTGTVLASDDDGGTNACSMLRITVIGGDTVYVHVVEYGDNAAIPTYYVSMSLCGDAAATGGEVCDDGNTVEGDACDSNCTVPACGNGITGGTELCDDGNTTNGDTCDNNCTPPTCGNGVRAGAETCDDGNVLSTDGCSATCTVEAGYGCTTAIPNVCTLLCGNGALNGTEACDDGNAVSGDGCTTCTIDAGYMCSGAPSVCRIPGPGDVCAQAVSITAPTTLTGQTVQTGFIGAASACTGSGGNARWYSVTVPPGRSAVMIFTPTGTPTWDPIVHRVATCAATTCTNTNVNGSGLAETLTITNSGATDLVQLVSLEANTATTNGVYDLVVTYPVCGNGAVEGTEQCDDAGIAAGDGCSATCTVEAGFACTGSPSVCGAITACPAGQTPVTVTGTPLPEAIPDFGPAGPISFVTTGTGTITRVQLGLTLTHTFDADLDMTLSVGGTSVDVSSDNGSTGDNYTDTLFSSTCANPVTSGTAPFTGCFRPEQDFSVLASQPLGSTYVLQVTDDTGGDAGNITAATLYLCTIP